MATDSQHGDRKGGVRDYGEQARASVREVYGLNHRYQTLEFVRQKKEQYLSLDRQRMKVFEAMEFLDEFIDESDPDTELGQSEHLLQTAESIRRAGLPDWFVLTGLVHDLGKVLCSFDEPQWAVVGDTFPVGCAFSEKIVHADLFAANPDSGVAAYSTELGIYEEGCGLDSVQMSWGHDEYLYHVLHGRLPEEALYVIRYHSFYAAHDAGAYGHLMSARDREMFSWVSAFSAHDLYSKLDDAPSVGELKKRYAPLVAEYLPDELRW